MSKKTFLSHSTADLGVASTLVEELESRGMSIWFAPRDIPGGVHYGEQLTSAIKRSDAFLLLTSQHSIGRVDTGVDGSKEVLGEIQTAGDHQKHIVPLTLDDTNRLTCHIRFQHMLALPQAIDIRSAISTGHYDRICELIFAAVNDSRSQPSAKARNELYEVEVCLKNGNYAAARTALAVAGRSPQDAERAELLKVIAQLQQLPVNKLNKTTADALVERLLRLRGGAESPAVLYVLGTLSVHFYKVFSLFDPTGSIGPLKTQARKLTSVAPKYVIMMRHAIPDGSRFELDWRL